MHSQQINTSDKLKYIVKYDILNKIYKPAFKGINNILNKTITTNISYEYKGVIVDKMGISPDVHYIPTSDTDIPEEIKGIIENYIQILEERIKVGGYLSWLTTKVNNSEELNQIMPSCLLGLSGATFHEKEIIKVDINKLKENEINKRIEGIVRDRLLSNTLMSGL